MLQVAARVPQATTAKAATQVPQAATAAPQATTAKAAPQAPHQATKRTLDIGQDPTKRARVSTSETSEAKIRDMAFNFGMTITDALDFVQKEPNVKAMVGITDAVHFSHVRMNFVHDLAKEEEERILALHAIDDTQMPMAVTHGDPQDGVDLEEF